MVWLKSNYAGYVWKSTKKTPEFVGIETNRKRRHTLGLHSTSKKNITEKGKNNDWSVNPLKPCKNKPTNLFVPLIVQ